MLGEYKHFKAYIIEKLSERVTGDKFHLVNNNYNSNKINITKFATVRHILLG